MDNIRDAYKQIHLIELDVNTYCGLHFGWKMAFVYKKQDYERVTCPICLKRVKELILNTMNKGVK